MGGDDDDVTILCADERGNTKPWLAEFADNWADVGRNDEDDGDAGRVCWGFEDTEEDEDEESTLLGVDFALGMEDKGWKKNKQIGFALLPLVIALEISKPFRSKPKTVKGFQRFAGAFYMYLL